MTEWHLPPDYIVNNWTDELFDLMVEKLVERKQREHDAIEDRHKGNIPLVKPGTRVVSDEALLRKMRIKVVKT